jgi:hypothetical protein
MIVKRHTTSGEKIKPRKIGDAPLIGDVPHTSNAKPRGQKRRSFRTANKKKLPKHFFVLSVLACFVVMSLIVLIKIHLEKALNKQMPSNQPGRGGLFIAP